MDLVLRRRVFGALLVITVLAACQGRTGIVVDGSDFHASDEFELAEGTYAITWTVLDPGRTDHGCHFGLTLESTRDLPPVPKEGRWYRYAHVRLAYEGVQAGGTLSGSRPAIWLPANGYRLRSDGSCLWTAGISTGNPDALESDPGGPRMNQEQALTETP